MRLRAAWDCQAVIRISHIDTERETERQRERERERERDMGGELNFMKLRQSSERNG